MDYSSFLQSLRDKSNIVDVARKYVDLEKKGNKYWACCPIHNEKTPSFVINEERGIYHCFGCGASGDVFSFIQEVEHTDFRGAVQILADRAGMEVPVYKSNFNKEKKEQERLKKERLYQIMREAGKFYFKNLINDTGEASEYIKKRGFTSNTITTFGLGYSTGYGELIDYLHNMGFNDAEMLECGVAKEKNGKLYDFEAGRLIVPIFNNTNNVVAFGGRVLGQADFMKYKNTEETLIFKKRNELFGVHTLKKAKLTEHFNCVIVVEGYMDVISLYQAGIKNVCASMGTALTIEQARMLKYYNNNIYLCYDGDNAGQKATYKGIDVLRDAGLNVKVIQLIEGKDPDDIIKEYGVSKFKQLIDEAISPTEYKIRTISKEFDLSTPDGQGKFAVSAIKVLDELSTMVEREAYLPMISELSRLSIDSLRKHLDNTGDNQSGYKESHEPEKQSQKFNIKPSVNKYYYAARYMIYSIFAYNALDYIQDNLVPYFEDNEHIAIYDYARELVQNNIKPTLEHLKECENNGEAVKIAESKFKEIPEDCREQLLNDCFISLKKDYLDMKQQELMESYNLEENLDKKSKITAQLADIIQQINDLKRRKNGK